MFGYWNLNFKLLNKTEVGTDTMYQSAYAVNEKCHHSNILSLLLFEYFNNCFIHVYVSTLHCFNTYKKLICFHIKCLSVQYIALILIHLSLVV